MKQQRRVFLKVLAAGPLVGCGGAPDTSALGDSAGSAGKSSGGGGGAGSTPAPGGASSGGMSASSAGSPPLSGNTGGTGFVVGGRSGSSGGASTAGGTSAGGSGTSAGGMGAGGMGMGGTSNPGMLVAQLSDYPVGSFSIADGLFFLGRDAEGLFAMSMQCTHKFCALTIEASGLYCPCHKSLFDRDGKVLMGPATTPLPHYAVFVDGAGNISVDKFTLVAPTTRTPVDG